ncbi:hypothetical protein WISP_41685 [Willisornis vidua]|uniref:Uncharacterized protein n=1 Tax=Willisornis vidua TaxID=1566151 RepID=A0ABQ9DL49_9PASS|nr:hypothetical protein WISP_41685 [Willisornis vidua]
MILKVSSNPDNTMIHDPDNIDSPTRGYVLLDLLVISASELTGNTEIGDSPGCSDPALVEFAVLRDVSQVNKLAIPEMNAEEGREVSCTNYCNAFAKVNRSIVFLQVHISLKYV